VVDLRSALREAEIGFENAGLTGSVGRLRRAFFLTYQLGQPGFDKDSKWAIITPCARAQVAILATAFLFPGKRMLRIHACHVETRPPNKNWKPPGVLGEGHFAQADAGAGGYCSAADFVWLWRVWKLGEYAATACEHGCRQPYFAFHGSGRESAIQRNHQWRQQHRGELAGERKPGWQRLDGHDRRYRVLHCAGPCAEFGDGYDHSRVAGGFHTVGDDDCDVVADGSTRNGEQ
jgi:hypothetical protein